jgi:hypothetical protein
MTKLEGINRWLNAIIAAIAVLSVDYFQRLFVRIGWNGAFYLLPPLFLALLGMSLVEPGANLTIEKSRWLRRLVSGKDDIEGDWVNIVVAINEPELVKAVEYCRIRYVDGRFALLGDQWTVDGRWVQDFRSADSRYANRELEFYYKTGLNRVGGYCVVRFSPADAVPSDYIARYIDEECLVPHVTRGRRLSQKFLKDSIDERRQKAISFYKDYQTEGLLDIERGIR